MSRLTELLRQAYKTDSQLGADLETEISALMKRRNFGLVFERHQPEAVELAQRVPRRGDKVRILPPRGTVKAGDSRLWRIERIERTEDGRVGHLTEIGPDDPETAVVNAEDLVVVAEFSDPLFPGLVETGRLERGGDKPFHTVINAENFHALQMLTFTHRGKIDAIYIDPPYNTGAKDWKYNNDYVEGDDQYRHSKWLSMMERRLNIARELLNPDDSVLIVTIDEKEHLRLGLLLEQTFPEATIQMVTIIMSSFGSPRKQALDRVDEYAFFVGFGDYSPARVTDDLLSAGEAKKKSKVRWESLLRSGSNFRRSDRPNLFYPVFVSEEDGTLVGFGESKAATASKSEWSVPEGSFAFWPTRNDGSDGRWQVSQGLMQELFDDGLAYIGSADKDTGRGSVYYLTRAQRESLRSGSLVETGTRADGSLIVEHSEGGKLTTGKSVWNRKSHAANLYGTSLVKSLLGGRSFPFPKSLYAVEDTLRFAVSDKPNATVLDFFSGSGTTAHAVMRLNKQDNGRRQCISVTNNEVSAEEQKKLRLNGLRPGDPEWEQWGICDYVTKPRIKAAITGLTPEGEPIEGDYKFTDEFPMADGFDENAAFFSLTYEGPLSIRHDKSFDRIATLLWMRAGAQGRIINDLGDRGWDIAEQYAVLKNLDAVADFAAEVSNSEQTHLVYIVTDDETAFQMVCRELPANVEKVRLYESYLQNFMINTGRSF